MLCRKTLSGCHHRIVIAIDNRTKSTHTHPLSSAFKGSTLLRNSVAYRRSIVSSVRLLRFASNAQLHAVLTQVFLLHVAVLPLGYEAANNIIERPFMAATGV